MKIAKDGMPVVLAVLFISLLLVLTGWLLATPILSIILYLLALAISGFTLFFFRDPERNVPQGAYIISPADGKVLSVDTVREETYLNDSARQISIFLSITDVHVNRYPVTGMVEHVAYMPGEYLLAWHPKASELNERAEFGVKHSTGLRVFYRQITGYVARRIVFHTKEGDQVVAGDRFGIMKFGSRMDVLLPLDMEIEVKEGDILVGGETILAKIS
ncbi:phosphatidylserine decarboxylase family protein [Balneolaceae bacterium ANBcel3]|nr:phosphatidylserine decarboxylase family protein [Balneolaceae bacterium ANBcel3]